MLLGEYGYVRLVIQRGANHIQPFEEHPAMAFRQSEWSRHAGTTNLHGIYIDLDLYWGAILIRLLQQS